MIRTTFIALGAFFVSAAVAQAGCNPACAAGEQCRYSAEVSGGYYCEALPSSGSVVGGAGQINGVGRFTNGSGRLTRPGQGGYTPIPRRFRQR